MTPVRFQIADGNQNSDEHYQNDEPDESVRFAGMEGFGRNLLCRSEEDGRLEGFGRCGDGAGFGWRYFVWRFRWFIAFGNVSCCFGLEGLRFELTFCRW